MITAFSLVGRTRFELVTNGLKGRYAHAAPFRLPLCAIRTTRILERFLPRFCRKSPTMTESNPREGKAAMFCVVLLRKGDAMLCWIGLFLPQILPQGGAR